MLTELRLDENAPWKQRFRAPRIPMTQLAKSAPERGLAVSNHSGVFQLYAWEVSSGELTQLTDREGGVLYGMISPDGPDSFTCAIGVIILESGLISMMIDPR